METESEKQLTETFQEIKTAEVTLPAWVFQSLMKLLHKIGVETAVFYRKEGCLIANPLTDNHVAMASIRLNVEGSGNGEMLVIYPKRLLKSLRGVNKKVNVTYRFSVVKEADGEWISNIVIKDGVERVETFRDMPQDIPYFSPPNLKVGAEAVVNTAHLKQIVKDLEVDLLKIEINHSGVIISVEGSEYDRKAEFVLKASTKGEFASHYNGLYISPFVRMASELESPTIKMEICPGRDSHGVLKMSAPFKYGAVEILVAPRII